jgi:tetratricopeptide (TPR) repeat protein
MGTSARIDELRKKFEENPRRYFAPLANEYRKAGDLEQAIFICQEYLPQQPGHMSGHIVYGQALFESGRTEEAKAVFDTALSLDPENLIALRHLGDIAKGAGDFDGARGWYQRVLDTDPRNEEIVQLLASLDAGSIDAGPPPVTSPPADDAYGHMTTTIAPSDEAEDDAGSRSAPVPEIEKSEDLQSDTLEFGDGDRDDLSIGDLGDLELPPLPPSHPAPAAATPNDDDLLDLDDFSLGGIQVGTPSPATPAGASSPAGLDGDVTISGGFTLGTEDEPFEADPFAIAAKTPTSAPAPEIELSGDIDLGVTDDSVASSEMAGDAPSLAGLVTFEAGIIAGVPKDVPALETDAFFDLPAANDSVVASTPVADPVISPVEEIAEVPDLPPMTYESPTAEPDTEHASDQSSEPAAAEAFVTETMAELYIQQGHLDSALDIYRRLVEQRPDEPELRERLRAIEDRMFGSSAGAGTAADDVPSHGGPTIREFLVGLVGRRPSNGGSRSSGETAPPAEDVAPPTRAARMTPGASETVTGSIDALFSGASPSVSDAAAADAFAAAFSATVPEPTPPVSSTLSGTPAHRAADELSLDHVFKAITPTRECGAANGFSFDQFFADEMTDTTADSPGDPGAGAPEATDDIAQFNAWLNGLKKT